MKIPITHLSEITSRINHSKIANISIQPSLVGQDMIEALDKHRNCSRFNFLNVILDHIGGGKVPQLL